MKLAISYTVFASGLGSLDGAPLRGFLIGNSATFGLDNHQWPALPALRRWIREAGGSIVDETGTPAPASTIDDDALYAVSLGPSVDLRISGLERESHPCPECGLAVLRLHRGDRKLSSRSAPERELISTARASWVAAPALLADLTRAGLAGGLVQVNVETRAGLRIACWPENALASHLIDAPGVSRCGTCQRNIAVDQRREAVPRFSLGLFVDAPADSRRWFWHARLGQHLPIVRGEVVRYLQERVALSALPVITDPAEAFLPDPYR